ncbi:flagellar basal body-associated FliL family protein [Sphingomonas sp. RS2018]
MSDTKDDAKPAKKKGKMMKLLVLGVGLLVLVGGGVGAGLYAASSGMIGGKHDTAAEEDADKPKLVPKSEEKRAGEGGAEGGEGGGDHGGGGEEGEAAPAANSHAGMTTPAGEGGDKYASTYYTIEKEFTSNLKESVHFIQVGLAVSTPYDDRVIGNLKTHEIAVRSAILMTLGDTEEDAVFTNDGKEQLQKRLVAAINGVLKQKEGFGGIGNVYFTNFVVQ